MKLTVSQVMEEVKVFGQYDPVGLRLTHERLVFIDDKLVPPGLARIILLGLDVAAEKYADSIMKQMEAEGYQFNKVIKL